MKYDIATPYIASYVILRRDNKALFVMRANTGWSDGYWGLPSGKVEKNESYLQAAAREAKEEVGVTVKPANLKHLLTSHRSQDGNNWVDVIFEAKQWEGDPYNAEPEIHSEVTWLEWDALPDNVVPSLDFMIEQIKAGKVYCEYGWPSAIKTK